MGFSPHADRQVTEQVARRMLGKVAKPYSPEYPLKIVNHLYSMVEFSIRFDRGNFE